jgi:hypothetical protein
MDSSWGRFDLEVRRASAGDDSRDFRNIKIVLFIF